MDHSFKKIMMVQDHAGFLEADICGIFPHKSAALKIEIW